MELSNFQLLALIGVVFAVLEIFTSSFVLLPAGLAFLFTAPWALAFSSWSVLLGFLCAHLLLVYAVFYFFVWPKMRKVAPKSGAKGMVGQVAIVTEEIGGTGDPGYVQLYGDSFKAVSDGRFSVGTRVTIVGLDGNKVIVGPLG